LTLVRTHGRVEEMPSAIRDALGDIEEVRRIYLDPDVTDDYTIEFGEPDRDGVVEFLCGERQFGRDRVIAALDRAFRPSTLF
jgi:flap endonuclease-1